MGSKILVISPESLRDLLVHYTDGVVPLDARIISIGTSQYFQRWIGIEMESGQWSGDKAENSEAYSPLHLRYEGKKILTWGDKHKPYEWHKDHPGK
jgi:hypothetical protein